MLWFCFFASATFGMAQDAASSKNMDAVLFVNRQSIGAEEFAWFMQQERAGVFQFVKAKFNLDYGTNFWDRELSGGDTPRSLLRQRTVERIVREKVQQLLFRELGLVQDTGYASFLKNLEAMNNERESAARQGQVIYGPVRYSALQYYEYWMTNLRLRAIEKLSQSRWNVSDAQVKDFYERNKERYHTQSAAQAVLSFEKARPLARSQYLDSLYNQLVSERIKQADVRLNPATLDALIQ
jgi:hypothetical protein